MQVQKYLKLVKQENNVVLLYDFVKNKVVASFLPGQSVVKETTNPNRVKLMSFLSPSAKGYVLNFRTIDTAQCSPIIDATDVDAFIVELATKFFFLKDNSAKAKIYQPGEFAIFQRNGNSGETLQVGDVAFGLLADGNTFIPFGKYLGGDAQNTANWDTSPIDFS